MTCEVEFVAVPYWEDRAMLSRAVGGQMASEVCGSEMLGNVAS